MNLRKTLKSATILAVSAVVSFSAVKANADAQLTTQITATVQNAFNFVEGTPLSFGSFAIFTDGTTSTTIVVDLANGATHDSINNGSTRTVPIIPATTGIFNISAAAPGALINITYNGDDTGATGTTLVCAGCTGSQPDFEVGTFTDNSTAGVITTDGTGAFALTVGATLTSDEDAAPGAYEDGIYSGTLVVDANY